LVKVRMSVAILSHISGNVKGKHFSHSGGAGRGVVTLFSPLTGL
jgi:hypothetical protein